MDVTPEYCPKFGYLDLPRDPAAMLALRDRVRRNFAESLDAMDLCALTPAGRQKLMPRSGKPETCDQGVRYQLQTVAGQTVWSRKVHNRWKDEWREVPAVGCDALFGSLNAEVTKLDAFLFGPHPLETNVTLALRDSTVRPGMTQREDIFHLDASLAQIEAKRRHFVYIIQSHGEIAPVFLNGYTGENDPMHRYLMSYAHYSSISRGDEYKARMRRNPDYLAAVVAAKPRMMQPQGMTVTVTTNRGPHAGVCNQTGTPIRRQFAWQIIERPTPVVL